MKGEKIDNDNYQKVFEENLVNTIDYSNKKTNKKFKQIVVFVILLFVILLSFILFNTKSELVNSDTYPIYQEVHINNKITIPVIEEYILNNIKMEENDTLKNFTSFEIFSVEQKKENYYYVYAWVLEQSYESNGEVLYEQSGSSYPCRFELYKENNTYIKSMLFLKSNFNLKFGFVASTQRTPSHPFGSLNLNLTEPSGTKRQLSTSPNVHS